MEKHLFLGDEAIAQAAIDAGISGVYALSLIHISRDPPRKETGWMHGVTGCRQRVQSVNKYHGF